MSKPLIIIADTDELYLTKLYQTQIILKKDLKLHYP